MNESIENVRGIYFNTECKMSFTIGSLMAVSILEENSRVDLYSVRRGNPRCCGKILLKKEWCSCLKFSDDDNYIVMAEGNEYNLLIYKKVKKEIILEHKLATGKKIVIK